MFSQLPPDATGLPGKPWSHFEPYFKDLESRPLDKASLPQWMADWSQITALLEEMSTRLFISTTVDTTNQAAKAAHHDYLDNISPAYRQAAQRLKHRLLGSGLRPDRFDVQLAWMRVDVEVFRDQNLPLFVQQSKYEEEYYEITGAQTVQWSGRELTLEQVRPYFQEQDREIRQRAWMASMKRQMDDRAAIDDLWRRELELRQSIAANAGFPDYRAFRWKQMYRFDYTPGDCEMFHDAIEQVAVPATQRLYQRRARQLGLPTLRPWDLSVDPAGRPPLRPFSETADLVATTTGMFSLVDPEFGDQFGTMAREGLLDLESRMNKAPGGYCSTLYAVRKPFIFMNAVGLHGDVQTLLHEGGHSFHALAAARLPLVQQIDTTYEFSEVASMTMELLASPYLERAKGGFYQPDDARRAMIEHLEGLIEFWPYMAVVDAFQHWAYLNPATAVNGAACDRAWDALWVRFQPGIDYTGLEGIRAAGWQRKLHIFTDPFYYVEYGMAQMGAVQIWGNAMRDQDGAVRAYREALALGGTVPLPELYRTAGARFAIDAVTLGEAVGLIEQKIEELYAGKM